MLVHNPTITGSLVVSGSIITTGTLTGGYNYTELSGIPQGIISSSNQIDLVFNLDGVISSSNQFNALSNTSASYATTASYALNAGGGGGVGFPFSGSAVITGSLLVTEGVSANSFTETSALRFKKEVTDLENNNFIYQLRPVRFNWKETDKPDIGLIAEEVQNIVPELVGLDELGQVEGVKYSKITSLLIKAVQDQQIQINELKEEIAVLKKS